MVKVELFECLDAVERDAAGALDREGQENLFNRLSWFRLLQRHCPPPGKLLVARAQDADGGRSWLFMAVRHRRARAYANWYTLSYEVVQDPVRESIESHLPAIAAALKKLGLVSVALHPLRNLDRYRSVFAESGWRTFGAKTNVNWLADVGELSLEDYWSRRPARLRNTAARKAKAAPLECRVYNSFEAEAWSAYERVYRSSWKPQEGSPSFLRALAEQEGAAGTLRLGIARLGREPVAAQFWLVENGRATIHKLAHREDAKQHSPGVVLSTAMFRSVIDDDRVSSIDYGLGDEAYKAEWMDRSEPVGQIVAYNPRAIRGAAGALGETAAALVRRVRTP